MSLPGNGIFVVRGEMSILMTAMRRGTRWSSSHVHHQSDDDIDGLIRSFQQLKDVLHKIDDLRLIEPNVYLAPFLSVIRSEETTGSVTSLALSAVNKFLAYGLFDLTMHNNNVPVTVHQIADAVTHARFVGSDHSSDGVVLMRILQVLRTLTLAPEGATLTNESLCEIMLSCFRLCFETRLNELLRRTAEHYLKDMVQLVFMRLPQFSEDLRAVKQFKMKPGGSIEPQTRTRRKSKTLLKPKQQVNNINKGATVEDDETNTKLLKPPNHLRDTTISQQHQQHLSTTPTTPGMNIVDMQGSISQSQATPVGNSETMTVNNDCDGQNSNSDEAITNLLVEPADEDTSRTIPDDNNDMVKSSPAFGEKNQEEYVNQRGIRFMPEVQDESEPIPYGLACVRELFRFLISLCNPLDKQNTDVMIHLGLTLLTVAFEVGADSIGKYSTLLVLVKDDLCRNLFSLLNTERLSVFAANLQVCFLMFESLRTSLKYQLEFYLTKLIEIIVNDSGKYEHKEIALDNIVQLWRIPGLVTELYLNYDCNMYCTNLYEDLTKLLAKNAFSATSGIYHVHMLSLDALLTVIESIQSHCSDHNNKTTMIVVENDEEDESGAIQTIDSIIGGLGLGGRTKLLENVPSYSKEDLLACKNMKKWLPMGTEHFNHKPKKGIQFLQEHGVLSGPDVDPYEIAKFLKENSALDKKTIGEYISNRSNLHILDAFVKTFDFTNMRLDEALRHYLETFRLPGEAPLISLLLEHFAEHWHKSNGEPFVDVDSAFTLAYAIIMLNVDQHNQNAKKQTVPMSQSGFKKNLKGVNGGLDFNEEMLDEIYHAIKNEEIVMPAEQTGLVRENYLWKVLLRKGLSSKDGTYIHVTNGIYDAEIFSIIWGPVVAALSYIFDKTDDQLIYTKALRGFEQCAVISSHFAMTSNLDMLILTLCKFTTFHHYLQQHNNNSTTNTNNNSAHVHVVNFGSNIKARLALKTVFDLCHQYGNNIRLEGWKSVFDLIVALYAQNSLLPKTYIEAEDFIEQTGKIVLIYQVVENAQKNHDNTGLFSSLYSYMVSSENHLSSKCPSIEEQQFIDLAKDCIKECNLEQLITDTKFLHDDSLRDLVKALIELSNGPDVQKSLSYYHNNYYNENVTIFFLELLIKILILNRDRVMTVWHQFRDHLYKLMMNASVFDYQFLLERSVIGLLRMAIRLMRNEEMSPIVLQSLRMLLLLKTSTLGRVSRQVSFGLYELLKTSAQNIHTNTDWTIVFTLLECVGAGAQPPKPIATDDNNQCGEQVTTKSDCESPTSFDEDDINTDRGYTSDSELTKSPKHGNTIVMQQRSKSPILTTTTTTSSSSPVGSTGNTGGWILVGNEGEIQPVIGRIVPPSQYSLALAINLGPHDPASLIKCCECLAFLVRDVAHITPYNFDDCVHCIRTFVEANLNECKRPKKYSSASRARTGNTKQQRRNNNNRRSPTTTTQSGRVSPDDDDDDNNDNVDDQIIEQFPNGYHQISIQLLDLMHTLHTRTAQIFRWWAEEGGEIAYDMSLWTQGWCPLLQGIARLCCDTRKDVRMSAITYLQRALLVHDLQTLNATEWEECFNRVLFPLLDYLLLPISNLKDNQAMVETRMRAAAVLSKVFLHHLTPLLSLPTFFNLWLIILDFMDKYMHADVNKSELLYEAIPESLKNMLLVMDSAKVFEGKSDLWTATWTRIDQFLPNMKSELFKEIHHQDNNGEKQQQQQQQQSDINNKDLIVIQSCQHNVENATRSSIILQPPPPTQPVSSHLFAHLGQMVSTPIPTITTTQQATILQPTLQPGMPYMMPNLLTNSSSITTPPNYGHTFPVLYSNSPVITTASPTEVQPVSLYTDYVNNPYNNNNETGPVISIPNIDDEEAIEQQEQQSDPLLLLNSNNNNCNVGTVVVSTDESTASIINNTNNNFFQSANYFRTDTSANNTNFPGSEILFGTATDTI